MLPARQILVALVLGFRLGTPGWTEDLPEAVVVVANRAVPESEELARYYADLRGIPESRICRLELPTGETMTRREYERALRDPLLQFLRDQALIRQIPREGLSVRPHETAWLTTSSSLRYLVPVFGVPLRISDSRPDLILKAATRLGLGTQRDQAAVDSELALILAPPYDVAAAFPNPLYNRLFWTELGPAASQLVVVGRLDGPSPAIVRERLAQGLEAEEYGLHGRGFFDSRSCTDQYFLGDYWIREACERFRREGYECYLDMREEMWSESFPMEDAAVYLGWYGEQPEGPFRRPGFSLRPGAIAYHLHSSSAAEVRTEDRFWVGPLMRLGAAATMGAVYEPFLGLTPNLDILASRLVAGYPFGDGVTMSASHLSWQITILGDPLYRPFRHGLDEQIARLKKEGRAEIEWAYLRKVNLLARQGRANLALRLCREQMEALNSVVLREKFAGLLALNGHTQDAIAQYRQVVDQAPSVETAVRAAVPLTKLLELRDRAEEVSTIREEVRRRWKGSPVLAALEADEEPP